MEPITAVTAALSLTKSAAELSKKLYEFGKGLKDREQKHQVEEMQDTLTEFKRSAAELEDQNRDLREKLRFKGDDYIFKHPFRYRKDNLQQPLCMKCFANSTEAPMGEAGHDCAPEYRRCLVCSTIALIGY